VVRWVRERRFSMYIRIRRHQACALAPVWGTLDC
jgi:hypothetical protein